MSRVFSGDEAAGTGWRVNVMNGSIRSREDILSLFGTQFGEEFGEVRDPLLLTRLPTIRSCLNGAKSPPPCEGVLKVDG
jgi:hypothetical protein